MSEPGCLPAAQAERLGHAFCAALERFDPAALRDLLAPDAVLWQNFTGQELRGKAEFAFLDGAFPALPHVRLREIRITPTPSGWVQHDLDFETPEGYRLRGLKSCCVIAAAEGRIARIEEYLDRSYRQA